VKAANVLVVCLTLLVAAGLLLAFLGRTRETADRLRCQDHLRLIGLGLQNYHDIHGSFPAAAVPNDALPAEKRLSWLFDVDPYLVARMSPGREQGRAQAWDAPENGRLVRQGLPAYLCPANPHRGEPDGPALTHYVGIAGVGPDAAELPVSDARVGVFGYDRRLKDTDIKDGVSVTLLVAETDWENGPWAAAGFATTRGLDPARQPYLGQGQQFGGTHRGGGMVGFADASVRFLREGIDPRVFEALATVAGGEDVAPSFE
jgi:hypothetical protein